MQRCKIVAVYLNPKTDDRPDRLKYPKQQGCPPLSNDVIFCPTFVIFCPTFLHSTLTYKRVSKIANYFKLF